MLRPQFSIVRNSAINRNLGPSSQFLHAFNHSSPNKQFRTSLMCKFELQVLAVPSKDHDQSDSTASFGMAPPLLANPDGGSPKLSRKHSETSTKRKNDIQKQFCHSSQSQIASRNPSGTYKRYSRQITRNCIQ